MPTLRLRSAVLALLLAPACAGKGAVTPAPIPATPIAQCKAAHDHILSLSDAALPADEDEVHDILSDLGHKDDDVWTKACMTDQAKEAPCALRATSLSAIDACNGSQPRDTWTVRVGLGECAAMFAHMTDVALSSRLEGGELDPQMRNNIRQGIEQQEQPDDADLCAKLAHADVACFFAARDVDALKACGKQLRKNSPEFAQQMQKLAGAAMGGHGAAGDGDGDGD